MNFSKRELGTIEIETLFEHYAHHNDKIRQMVSSAEL